MGGTRCSCVNTNFWYFGAWALFCSTFGYSQVREDCAYPVERKLGTSWSPPMVIKRQNPRGTNHLNRPYLHMRGNYFSGVQPYETFTLEIVHFCFNHNTDFIYFPC